MSPSRLGSLKWNIRRHDIGTSTFAKLRNFFVDDTYFHEQFVRHMEAGVSYRLLFYSA